MAYDLQTARQAAQQRGEKPPGGELPGTPEYDRWVMDWFEAGLNAGDPDLVRRAGGSQAEEAEGGIADWQNAADPSTWLGIRKPTPRELRKWAITTGRSEDYQRFDDRQLADWIGRKWDVGQGSFVNDFGDLVDKPTESGQRSLAAGYATGESSVGKGGGGGGGGGGKAPTPAQPAPEAEAYKTLDDPLQAALYQLVQSRGLQGQRTATNASSLAGGGTLAWGFQQPTAPTPAAPAPATPPAPAGPKQPVGEWSAPPIWGPGGSSPVGVGVAAPGGEQGKVGVAPSNPWANWMTPNKGAQGSQQPAWQGIGGMGGIPAPGGLGGSLLDKFKGRNPYQQWWMR